MAITQRLDGETMSNRTIKFGILGCGVIAQFHAQAINSLDNALLIGVADVSFAMAQKFAEICNITAYADFDAMLADENIDAVCICTPSGFHAQNAMRALQAKKHVVLEKPMAFSRKEAMELDAAAKESGCVLTVISQMRFCKDIRRIKELMEQNAFGKLVLCDLYMKYWRDPKYYASSSWKGTRKFDGGGALMNQGIHGVDILLYLAGNANLAYAKTRTHFHKIEVEDFAIAALEFENGAMGVIEATTCSYPGFDLRLEIIGTGGSVILVEDRIEKLIIGGEVLIDSTEASNIGTASDPTAMGCELHAQQIANFLGAICQEEELLMTASEGARAVSLIEQIYNFG